MFFHKISRLMASFGFCAALFCTPHCATKESSDPSDAAAADLVDDGVILSAATWTLGWKTEGVTFDAAGGFSLTTNLGYRLHIETGNIVVHRVALIPCSAPSMVTAGWMPLSIRSAYAHDEEADPSSIETLMISDVVHPKLKEIGANAFAPERYCQLFWLVARGMPGAVTSDGRDMSNRSIYFEGTWERDGASGPILVDSWWPSGVITNMKDHVDSVAYAEAGGESSVHFGFIGIDLDLGRMFDDIEFATDSDAIVTDSILDNILAGADLTIDIRSP